MVIEYNKTQLDPETTFIRHVYHRDQFAHYLRWTHVLKIVKIGQNILDFGCGTKANLAEVLYRNKFKANIYLGYDIRDLTNAIDKFKDVPWIHLQEKDLVKDDFTDCSTNWDIITCFEVIEHIQKQNAIKFLSNIKKHMNKDTILLLSTPNYDEDVGAANNHIINNEVCEFKHFELKELLQQQGFYIERCWGTFASQKDYKEYIEQSLYSDFYYKSKDYFDSNILSNLMAPLIPPEFARNCLWRLRLK